MERTGRQGWTCIYRPDVPVNLEELLRGRVERVGTAHLFYQVATSEAPLVLFEWPGPAEPIRGSLYLVTFGLHKTFAVMRSRVGPNAAVAAYRGMGGQGIIPLSVVRPRAVRRDAGAHDQPPA